MKTVGYGRETAALELGRPALGRPRVIRRPAEPADAGG
jgi:hypothetical protein